MRQMIVGIMWSTVRGMPFASNDLVSMMTDDPALISVNGKQKSNFGLSHPLVVNTKVTTRQTIVRNAWSILRRIFGESSVKRSGAHRDLTNDFFSING